MTTTVIVGTDDVVILVCRNYSGTGYTAVAMAAPPADQQNVQSSVPGQGLAVNSPLIDQPPRYTSGGADTSTNPQVIQGNPSWLVSGAGAGGGDYPNSAAAPPRYNPNQSSAPSIVSSTGGNGGMTAAAWGQQQQQDPTFVGSQQASNAGVANSIAGHGLMPESDVSFAGSVSSNGRSRKQNTAADYNNFVV